MNGRWLYTKEHYFEWDKYPRVSLCGQSMTQLSEKQRCKVCERALDSSAKRQGELIKEIEDAD